MRNSDCSADVCSSDLIKQDIAHPLSRPMIGILSATAGTENGKATGIDQVRRFCAGARRVDRRMFDKPAAFIRSAERRLANAWIRTCRSRGSHYHLKKTEQQIA